MTAEYKKRAKAGWSSGKGHKEESNRAERSYAKLVEMRAETALSADVEDLIIRSECNHELNIRLSEIEDEAEPSTVPKKKKGHKEITRILSSLRYVIKFAQNHANGDVEMLRFSLPSPRGEWWNSIRHEYYQRYKTQTPELVKALERNDLPPKLRRQILEVLALFKIVPE